MSYTPSISKQNLVRQMIYGIQASKDVKLSNISRALQEDIPLIKTEDRLSRNLNDIDLTAHINNTIMRLGDDNQLALFPEQLIEEAPAIDLILYISTN